MLTFTTAVLAVDDVERSAAFYRDIIGQRVVFEDHNAMLFDSGLELHRGDVLNRYAYGVERGPDGRWGHDNCSVMFRSDDIDGDFERLSAVAEVLHPVRMEPWGERLFRVLDPDGHIVEVAEFAA